MSTSTTHNDPPVRWGFLGVGMLAQNATAASVHAGTDMELFASAARDPQRAATINPRVVHANYQALIDDPNVEAVYISLQNSAHFPWIEASLEAGKHVLCEKPLTLTSADTVRAFDIAESHGLILAEATWALWSPRMRRITQIVDSGLIGDPENYLGTFTFNSVPENNYRLEPELGGGALFDVGIYPLHVLVSLLPKDTLFTVTEARLEHAQYRVDMTTRAQITWRTPQGSMGTAAIIAAFNLHPSQRFLLKGSQGEIAISDDQAFTLWKQPGSLMINGKQEDFDPVDPYQVMFEQFSQKLRGKDAWLPEQWQSIRVAELVEQIQTYTR